MQLDIERPVAGGRMLARHGGRVVLVAGAIPGETVRARVERVRHQVVFARVVEVLRASPHRRDPGPDPACGGMSYAHIVLDRQRLLKADIIADAFRRIAGREVAIDTVHPSPEDGYRLRVRLHVRDGRLGSFREGTHQLCDVRSTRQLLDATLDVIDATACCLKAAGVDRLEAIELAENLDASQRVVHIETGHGEGVDPAVGAALARLPGVTGVSVSDAWSSRLRAIGGVPWVADPLGRLTGLATDPWRDTPLRRSACAFFQANRHLLSTLVHRVLDLLAPGPLVDLYAGVGLFALSAAATGREDILAVESDEVSARDLVANARPFGARVRVERRRVEDVLATIDRSRPLSTVVVDPPRTGMSRAALDGLLAARPPRIVYVSCDVATIARDAKRLCEAGYAMGQVEAFDLFPNTGHVEVLTQFAR